MSEESESQNTTPRALEPKFLTQTRFSDFKLPAPVLTGLDETGFTHCTPIQAQVLPISLSGKDVAGQAQTGTGKTAAFLVTIFSRLMDTPRKDEKLPSALIVAPTRELAYQIYDEAMALGRHTGFSMVRVVGGVDYQKQADLLKKGPNIVICTPGRIIDYYKQKIFKTSGIQLVVIDEADRLLDLGFAKDMRFILSKLPHYDKRQSMLFSATLSYRVMELTYEYMNLPEFIAVTPQEVTVDGIEQVLYHVGNEKKLALLLGLLEREDWSRMLIFANTKAGVEWLNHKLKGNNYPSQGITGDLPQRKRFQLMEKFKNGQIKILIATDVASRGIHVEDISHVINYDLPQDPENYIHRIGRTARAGKTGRALSLACERYVFHLEAVEKMLGSKLPVQWFEDDQMVADKAGPAMTTQKDRRRKPPYKKAAVGGKKRPPARREEKKIWASTYPGAFFGFEPPATEKPAAKSKEAPIDTEKAAVKNKAAATDTKKTVVKSKGAATDTKKTAVKSKGAATDTKKTAVKSKGAATDTTTPSAKAAQPASTKRPRRRRRRKKPAPKTVPVAEAAKE